MSDRRLSNPLAQPAPTVLESATFADLWRDALLPYLGIRLIFMLIGLFTLYYIEPVIIKQYPLATVTAHIHFPQVLWHMWIRFDSGFYLDIAQHGYWSARTLHTRSNWAFYPFYPLLLGLIGRFLGGSETAFSLAGLFVSNVAGCVAMVYLYRLVRREFSQEVAARTVLYQALFPMSFYLSTVYTEALFLALAVACIYYARQQSWWLSGLCGGLAALTRAQGVVLVLPVGWEYLRVMSERYAVYPEQLPQNWLERVFLRLSLFFQGLWQAAGIWHNWCTALALALIPAGLCTFMLYAKIQTGDALATFHTSAWGWGRRLSSPWRMLIHALAHPMLAAPLNWNFWLFNIIAALGFLFFTLWAVRRLPAIYSLYTAVMVLLPLSSNLLNSLGRYDLVVFPAFLLLALLSCNGRSHWHHFILIAFTAFQAIFLACFVIGIPALA
ncbi:MAG: glycosyltransferase family 39 protein [Ktedonobacteraceae bacterium]